MQTEAVASIKQEAVYMSKLVDRLLFLARADQKRQAIELDEVALSDLLAGIIHDSMLIDNTHTYLLESEDIYIKADAPLIKQFIHILLDNCAKYSKAGGHINVRAYQKDKNTIIEVEDDGPGVPEEKLERIFDRFYKVDNSRNRKEGGTGLGLSIAKWIVEEHGGEIHATNTIRGLLVTVLLPN